MPSALSLLQLSICTLLILIAVTGSYRVLANIANRAQMPSANQCLVILTCAGGWLALHPGRNLPGVFAMVDQLFAGAAGVGIGIKLLAGTQLAVAIVGAPLILLTALCLVSAVWEKRWNSYGEAPLKIGKAAA